jgi:hypothetical protein
LLEFSLSVSNQNTYFKYTSNNNKVKTSQLGINWYEPFSPYFHAGFELGYTEMTQIENNLASAQFTEGQYAGLLLRLLPIDNHFFSLTLNLNYRYNRTQGNSTNQETQFAWSESLLSSEVLFKPINHIDLFLAAEYQILNGEQRDSGNINQVTSFNSSKHQGYRFGINFKLKNNGVIQLERLTGFRHGTRIYFIRKF